MKMYVVVDRGAIGVLGVYTDIDEAFYEAEHLNAIIVIWKEINGKFVYWKTIE